MPKKTYVPGKDAALEDTISITSGLLKSLGLPIKAEAWLNPAPSCWSVHLRSTEHPWLSANGKGSSKQSCQASAQAELLERLSTNFFFSDYYLGKNTGSMDFVFFPDEKWFPVKNINQIPEKHPDGTKLLTPDLRNFYDPDGELTADLIHDINSENTDRGICALPFIDIESGETVYFPVNILHNLYASNGMSAGNTPDECRSQALGEVLERYVKNQVIANGICLPDVPTEALKRFPRIQEALRELELHNFRIMVKDASLGGRFPVICMLLINPADSGCYAVFGASCRFEVALERTVTELLQGRSLNQLDGFQSPSHDLEPVSDSLNLESHFINSDGLLAWSMFSSKPGYEFCSWDFSGTTAEEYDSLKNIITREGFKAYCAEYYHCGIYTCRFIVPGMSEIYPVSDLLWDNRITGASLRTHLLTLQQMSIKELREFYGILEDLQFNEDQLISEAIGVIFEEDSAWHTLRIGELKALITLAAHHPEEAYTSCGWCINFGHLPPSRDQLVRAIYNLISFQIKGEDPTDYRPALVSFFGAETVSEAELVLTGNMTFPGLNFAPSWEEISPAHARLTSMYEKLNQLKQK